MALTIIPHNLDPRHPTNIQLVLSQKPPVFNSASFPPLPGSESHISRRNPAVLMVSYANLVQKWSCFWKYMRVGGKLPVEVRQVIWWYAMQGQRYLADSRFYNLDEHLEDPVQIRHYFPDRVANPKFLPWLCYLSKATKPEIEQVFISSSTFLIASHSANRYLQGWLATIDGVKNVRSLQFDFFDFFPPDIEVNDDLKLASLCGGLTTIRMSFHWRALEDFTVAEEMISRYKLKQILDCKKMNKIILHQKGRPYDPAMHMLQALGVWMQAEFVKQKQRVNIVLV
ncbi:hypothetical protein N0V90_002736 [Kalmusia sp. IMI 367209]|nr:hypothetical protein N0V90_002736 [Kalmusia sp. IMI 367209]